MASKKPVPLKDEQIYPADEILQHIEQLTIAVTNLANEQQTIIKDIEAHYCPLKMDVVKN